MDERYTGVEYVPPKPEAIRAFARSVCEALATRMNNPKFAEPYVITGLAAFLEIAARTQAKRLNDQQLIDREDK
jgi:hypothetical protein